MEQHGVAYDPNDRVSATLYAAYGTKWNGNSGAYNGDNFVFTQNQREEIRDLGDIAGSLSADRGTHQQTLLKTPCYGIDQQGGKGGANYTEDIAPTMASDSHGTPHAICYGIGSYDSNAWKSPNPHSGVYVAETARTLDAISCGYPACNQGGYGSCRV